MCPLQLSGHPVDDHLKFERLLTLLTLCLFVLFRPHICISIALDIFTLVEHYNYDMTIVNLALSTNVILMRRISQRTVRILRPNILQLGKHPKDPPTSPKTTA